jgi:hypothetical protein
LQTYKAKEQQEPLEAAAWDPEYGVSFDRIKQLRPELNQRVLPLEREL